VDSGLCLKAAMSLAIMQSKNPTARRSNPPEDAIMPSGVAMRGPAPATLPTTQAAMPIPPVINPTFKRRSIDRLLCLLGALRVSSTDGLFGQGEQTWSKGIHRPGLLSGTHRQERLRGATFRCALSREI
jgi:hypothetical protein